MKFALIIILLAGAALSATNLSGDIDVPTTFTQDGSPYVIANNAVVTLSAGQVLTVLEGTVITFGSGSVLDLSQGQLVVDGSIDSPVVFEAADFNGDWRNAKGMLKVGQAVVAQASFAGLVAVDGAASTDASFESVVAENCRVGLQGFNNVEISDSGFFNNQFGTKDLSGAKLSRVDFEGNEETAISGAGIYAEAVRISGSKVGIQSTATTESSALFVSNSSLTGNGAALVVKEGPKALVTYSNIWQNKVAAQGHYEGSMANNWWGFSSTKQIFALFNLDGSSTKLDVLVTPFFQQPVSE